MLKKLLEHQEIRFLLVGCLNTIVGYGIYALLIYFHMNYLIANTISTIIGVIHSYLWNRFFTFKSKEKAFMEILKFASVYFVSYLIGSCTLFLFKSVLNVSPYIAGFINLFITTIISFFGHKYFSFRKNKTPKSIKDYIHCFVVVGLFAFYFVLLCMYKNAVDFTDEGDVMLAAVMLSKGKFIYLDFASQHMPFTYFIMAPFAYFGVSSIAGFRISMYFILIVIWIAMYFRYRKYFSEKFILLYPVLYIMYMSFPDVYSSMILSEQFSAQFLVILCLEILIFFKRKKIDVLGKIIIPIMMVLAIGCSFVSILPCFIIVLALFYLDIKIFLRNKDHSFLRYISHFWKEYKIVLFVGFSCVFIFLLYLYCTHSLQECIEQAFLLNMNVYSKYNNYSSNPFMTILNILPSYLRYVSSILQFNFKNVLAFLLIIGTGFLSIYYFREDKVFGIFLLLFVLLCGNREFEGFHAIPYYGVAILGLLTLFDVIPKKYCRIFSVLLVMIFLKQCVCYFPSIFTAKPEDVSFKELIQSLSDTEDVVFIDINTSNYIHSGTIPTSRFSGMVPWFSEVYEEEYLEDIKNKNPNFVTYHPYSEVWGIRFKDFLPKVNEYILNHYVYIGSYNIWLRKDYIDVAEQRVQFDYAEYNNQYLSQFVIPLANNSIEQRIIPDEDISKIGFMFGTYERKNYSLIQIQILSGTNLVYETEFSSNILMDNAFYFIDLSQNVLQREKEYVVHITSKNTNDKDYVALYAGLDEFQIDKNVLSVNGYVVTEDLIMEMYYEK